MKMDRKGRILLGICALAAAGAGIYFFLHRGNSESTDDAYIEAHVMQVSPKISEKVLRVLVDDNERVKEGQLLVELDPKDTQALVNQARANLNSAMAKAEQARAQFEAEKSQLLQSRADVSEAEAQADNAGRELVRAGSLRKTGAIAQSAYDRARADSLASEAVLASKRQKALASESDVKVAGAAVASADAMVEQARALLDTADLRLGNTRIFAPADGCVTRKNVEPGNFVQPGNALMAVVSPEVWVVANFKETQLEKMYPGQVAEVRVDSFPGLRLRGRVDSIQSGTGSRFSLLPPENATGNFVKVVQRVPVKISLDLPSGHPLLAPGMSARPTVRIR